jgi:hypothetical protein
MACSSPDFGDDGFATPAATMISLAIATIAAAVTGAALAQLEVARRDWSFAKTEYALAGGQQIAALTALRNNDAARLRWTIPSPDGVLDALAEPEPPKLTLAAAADLSDVALSRLGVKDPISLRTQLHTLADDRRLTGKDIEAADMSPVWRRCARSIVSPFGQAVELKPTQTIAPGAGEQSWRAGETWRVRITAPDGWTDDRTLRFTGDGAHPAAVIEKRLYRQSVGRDPCDALMAAKEPL